MEDRIASILSEYPSIITLNQLYRICGISKRKGKWLLENGHIPCHIHNKKTHRFTIKLEDVIIYLREVEKNPQLHKPPTGMFNSHYRGKLTSEQEQRNRLRCINSEKYANYLQEIWKDEKDLLTVPEIKLMTGYSSTTIQRWIKVNEVESLLIYRSYYIIKAAIISQVVNLTINSPVRLSSKLEEIAYRYLQINP